MRCLRCRGLMILERYQEMNDFYFGWRCFLCGEVLDEVVMENRRGMRGGRDTHMAAAK